MSENNEDKSNDIGEEDEKNKKKHKKQKNSAYTFESSQHSIHTDPPGSSNQKGIKIEKHEKYDAKSKRTLRFQLPESSTSDESLTSALSFNWTESKQHEKEISVLKKYILAPLRRNEPRTVLAIPCHSKEELETIEYKMQCTVCLPNSSSSKQLFEVLRHSPTPSDADLSLIKATYSRKIDAVRVAIGRGANVNTFRDRQTPLMIATEMGDERLVRYFLEVPKINPNFQNIHGQTPLIVAVRNAFDEITELLLNHNADVNLADNVGRTPLHGALFQQRPHIIRLLLAFGANYEKSDVFGERPMYTAAVKKPSLECLKVLISVGASPEYHNVSGTTLLSRSILNWTDFKIIEMLVQYGASVNTTDLNSKKSPLHFAAMINGVRVAKFLLSQGADPNLRTVYNSTPYDEAIFHKSLDVAECLFFVTENASIKALNALRSHKRN